jgi:histidine triad (HIT) family protein
MTIFNRLIDGELPASFVWRDAQHAAFMDINPIRPGHVLVVPRQSVATLQELEPAARAQLLDLAVRIGQAQQRALGSRAQHLLVNDGRAASQTVPHVHIHVIPRYAGDTLRTLAGLAWHVATLALPRPESRIPRQRLDAQAAAIRAQLEA